MVLSECNEPYRKPGRNDCDAENRVTMVSELLLACQFAVESDDRRLGSGTGTESHDLRSSPA